MASDLPTITQVLLLFDRVNSTDFGLVIWATFVEIERFYNHDEPRATFQRYYVSPLMPRRQPIGSSIIRHLGLAGESQSAQDYLGPQQRREMDLATFDPPDKRADSARFVECAQKLMGVPAGDQLFIVVTDREVTPSPGERYSIWNITRGNAVISVRPIDPKYWRDDDPNRSLTIKQRVRTAGLSVTGSLLNFNRCENPQCFLYNEITSVQTLDFMHELGDEHGIPTLAGLGFRSTGITDPILVEQVVTIDTV